MTVSRLAVAASSSSRSRLLASPAAAATSRPRSTIALADCRLPKLPLAAQCGTLEVPENRDQARRPQDQRSSSRCCRPTRCIRAPIRCSSSPAARARPRASSRRSPRLDRRAQGSRHRAHRPARHRPLVAARLRGLQARRPAGSDARARSCPEAAACAQELAAQGVDAAQYTTRRVDRRPRSDARGAGLRQAEPVGRQLRHARRAGIPAPASGPRAQRRCSTASRRPR